jgi:hypothetical protein
MKLTPAQYHALPKEAKQKLAQAALLAAQVVDLNKGIPGVATNPNIDRRMRPTYAQQLTDEHNAKVQEHNALLAEVEAAVAALAPAAKS